MSKYELLTEWLREKIESGEFKPGERILSENEMCAIFGISRQTVRQSIGILENEGYLERRRGSGTYVNRMRQASPIKDIGVIAADPDDFNLPQFLRGLHGALAESGYTLQLAFTYNRFENEAKILKEMTACRLKGIIAEPVKSALQNPNRPLYEKINEEKIPCIFVNASVSGLSIPCVKVGDHEGGRIAVGHLIACNHESVGAMLPSDIISGHLRYYGYLNALNEAGKKANEDAVVWYTTDDLERLFQGGMDRYVMQKISGCTAVVCYNDYVAAQLVALLKRNGKSVPRDISVVGFGNSNMAGLLHGGLTTIQGHAEDIGKTAGANILRLMQEPAFDANTSFKPELIERSTVRTL